MNLPLSPSLIFSQAAERWLEARTFGKIKSKVRYCAPKTLKFYQGVLHALSCFFGLMPLEDIHLGNFEQYRLERCEKAKPNTIIQEENVLIAILKRAGCWTPEMEEQYEPIQREESDIPRALTPVQQRHWLDTARSQERWQIIYHYSVLAFRTAASNCELRGLRLQDVNLYQQIITIQKTHAKNKFRIRSIPLPPDALWAVERLMERARACGSILPHHYLFPYRYPHGPKAQDYACDRPMTEWGLDLYWDEVRTASTLAWFTKHCTRHTGITRMAEASVPMPVILSIAGHISQKMQTHYTHISEQAKLKAMMAVYEGQLYQDDLRERRPVQKAEKPPKSMSRHA